jgi:hypothetical protein
MPYGRTRSTIALLLTVIHLLMMASPIVAFASQKKAMARAVAGECSGDCDVCGCSPESRAAGTCCCSRKRRLEASLHRHEEQKPPCCRHEAPEENVVVISCGCPCGGNDSADLCGVDTDETLISRYSYPSAVSLVADRRPIATRVLQSRHLQPPDPPPKLL